MLFASLSYTASVQLKTLLCRTTFKLAELDNKKPNFIPLPRFRLSAAGEI